MRVFILLLCAWACQGRVFLDKTERYLIACHTTDFTCFKRQYSALRDHVFLGNAKLAIEKFEPHTTQYGDRCIQLTGWGESELMGIGMDSAAKELTMVLELPIHMQQVNETKCGKPPRVLTDIAEDNAQNGTPMEFTGNATVTVTYPFRLQKKKGDIYIILEEESVDALVDMPIFMLEDSETEAKLNKASDWAYDVIEHSEAAKDFALPFTSRVRVAMERIPYRRLMLLYPDEEYSDLQFAFIDLLL